MGRHGSLAAFGPLQTGCQRNPVVTLDGQSWTFDEILKIWCSSRGREQSQYPGNLTIATFHCEDDQSAQAAVWRLGRQRGRPGFGNARAVRALFDAARERQADRVRRERRAGARPDIFLLTRGDVLGPAADERAVRQSEAYRELQSLEGLAPVKRSVEELIKLAAANAAREARGKPPLDVCLNRVFLGNPGTGKTTVARIYGQLLARMGLLSKGDVVIKNPSDFVGSVLGSSEQRTRDILRAAEGSVLVIDEAYALFSGGDAAATRGNDAYKAAVVDTLVEQVQGGPGEDRAVVMLGYRDEMETLFKQANPGLARRFQLDRAFEFPDLDDDTLLRVLMGKARLAGLHLGLSVAKRAVASLARARARPHFGNAGAVDALLSAAKLKVQQRGGLDDELRAEDFGVEREGPDDASLGSLLEGMVGCDGVRERLERLRATVLFARAQGGDPRQAVPFNFLFVGNPGTGKTTVARRIGRMFKALGLLPDDSVREVSAADLVTGYVGQAGRKTRDEMERARGGVLFIDEAHQLHPERGGGFMTEAVDELVKCLTHPDFAGRMVVVLAGYERDVDAMLATNPGLRSRFPEKVVFSDLSPADVARLLAARMEERRLPIAPRDAFEVTRMARRLAESAGFSSGRDVEAWAKRAFQEVSLTATRDAAASSGAAGASGALSRRDRVRAEELRRALDAMLRERIPPVAPGSEPAPSSARPRAAACSRHQPPPPALAPATAHAVAGAEDASVAHTADPGPFEDVDKEVLAQLQLAMDRLGLNSEDGVRELARLEPDDPRAREVVGRLAGALGWPAERAEEQFQLWQARRLRQEEAIAAERNKGSMSGLRAIWRCAVCGRADKPYIACWVAPFVAYYERVPAGET